MIMDEIEGICYDYVMYQMSKPRQPQATKRGQGGRNSYTFFYTAMLAMVIVALLVGIKLFTPEKRVIKIAQPVSSLPIPTVSAVANLSNGQSDSSLPRDPLKPLVGIVSGHKGYDPGAVCPDGLTEAQVNYTAALEVVDLLERRGVQTDLLDEFDDRLADYQADALVSIHADSCMVPSATGFKVARVTDSAIPEAEDRLVACLNQEYATYTGLPQHPGSITDNMTNYHAFREIDSHTPGAIIEIGFLLDDRYILEHKPKLVARGIAAGILCFLEQERF